MGKLPEKLSILLGVGDTILARLHKVKAVVTNTQRRPICFTDPASIKVLNGCLKKFKDPDIASLDSILPAMEERYEEMEDYYFSFVDTMKFLNSTKDVIEELTGSVAAFQFDKNPVLTEAFLDLITLLVRALLLMASISDRRAIVLVFIALNRKRSQSGEENWQDLHAFLMAYDQPVRALQQSLSESVSQSLGHAVIDLMAPLMSIHNVEQMRKTGILSITNKPDEMCYPPITRQQLSIRLSPKLYMWVVYSFLLTPEQFAMPEPMEILRGVLNQSYLAPLYLNEVCYIHAEYEAMFSTYKSANKQLNKQFKKDKKTISEILAQSVQPNQGPKFRADRRTFVRHELKQLLLLMKDYPGLLGPKIGIIWGVLAIAKEEVYWYFAHRVNPPPKGTKGYQEKLYFDPHIAELVYYMEEMASTIRTYSYIIQQYYLEYLMGADLKQANLHIQNLLQKGATGLVADALNSIITDLQTINIETFTEGTDYSFRALRLNWFRVESWLVSPGCPAGDINSNIELTKRMNLIMYHSKNVDALDYLIWDYESLHGLVHYGEIITHEIDSCLQSSGRAEFLSAWLGLISKFPESVGFHNEEEKPVIGELCVKMATDTIGKIIKKIGDLLEKISFSYNNFDQQLEPAKSIYLVSSESVEGQTKYIISPNVMVGQESFASNLAKLEDLPSQKNLLAQLCGTLRNCEILYVYTDVYTPIAFLREELENRFKEFVLKSLRIPALDKEGTLTVQRPSVLLRRIEIYRKVLQMVSNYTMLDVTGIIQKVLADLTHHPVFESENSLDWVHNEKIFFSEEKFPLLVPYVRLYTDFVLQRMEYGAMIYSEVREAYIGRNFRAEDFCSKTEFEALARLIGIKGIQLIDRNLLKTVAAKFAEMKETVAMNQSDLVDLETFYSTDSCIPSARKLLDVELFALKCVSVGNCLCFRRSLYSGVQSAMKNLSSFNTFYRATETMFNLYPVNVFDVEELAAMDLLALCSGVDVHLGDPALRSVIKPIAQSGNLELWSLLPYMLSACIFTSVFQTTIYKPSLDAFTNNCGVMSETFLSFLVLFRSLTEEEDLNCICDESISKYLEVSSIIATRLLRINAKELQKKLPFSSLQSVVIFLDLFVEKAKRFVTKQALDKVTPYPLLRSLYHDIYLADNE